MIGNGVVFLGIVSLMNVINTVMESKTVIQYETRSSESIGTRNACVFNSFRITTGIIIFTIMKRGLRFSVSS